ncbi:MAG: hypothetical protein ROO76_00570 [Terriglobia bacterium]|jgi:hypothetical protein|nr:hypothetical protein [Terriglobia bacterium]
MDYETAQELAFQINQNWKTWTDLERGEAVVRLRDYGVSHRRLARIAGCSEGLIRHIEIVGILPHHWKQYLYAGYSTRRIVAAWRAQQRSQD